MTQQSVRRLLAELGPDALFSAGSPRRTHYALRRSLRGTLGVLPLFAVDAEGKAHQLGSLTLVGSEGTFLPLQETPWPVPAESREGWWGGLPYPIFAMRPTGYMGRLLARAEHTTLGVSEDPDEWDDDDILWVLSRRGSDVTGNLILGAAAYDIWLRNKVSDQPQPLLDSKLPETYARLASEAVTVGGGGSTAAGEFPKFAAMRELAGALTPHVLVKFSGASGTASEQRWGDLLVCEHLALECARQLQGVDSARSRILEHAGRVFIESERFDRVGRYGRLALCGLDAIDPVFLGSRESAWTTLADRLQHMRLIDAAGAAAIERLWWFGRLIANTDMHLGNLSFLVDRTLRLAPTYDMLPMAYAPLPGGEVPTRAFNPELPLPQQRNTWMASCTVAINFWNMAANDGRVSVGFRSVCRDNATRLRELADRV